MNAALEAARGKRPVFTHGSLMRHVAVMTATGAIGLMAVFLVDLLSLFWVSQLGDQAFKAAVGYVGLTTFFVMSINIGLTIAASATVSRALGAGDRPRARRLAASTLTITAVLSAATATAMFIFRDFVLTTLLHARGEPAEVASKFIAISIPANVPLAVGMAFSGILRAVGDARRAMYVTLSAGIATAFLDPVLIFGLGLGVYGAAWATVLSRLILLAVGWHGAVGVHDLVARPKLEAARGDFGPIMAIGFPAIMANMAAPVSSAYTLRVYSDFGEAAIASSAIIDRVTPVAFGVIFALTGSIGPIIGQNYGARLMGRVKRALTDSFILSIGYVLVAWALLALLAPLLIAAFGAKGDSAQYLSFYCRYGVSAWLFLACLFVANTAFNNLGFPVLTMAFNWARATLGTIPFVTFGAHYGGVQGAILGFALGCAVFGLIAVATAYAATWRLARAIDGADRALTQPAAPIGARSKNAMTLNDILHSAQGGQAVANLGAQYGLSPADAEKAAQAMIPAFSAALQQLVSHPGAIAGVLRELASGDHAASYAPGQGTAPGAAGGDALGRIFGSPQAVETVVQHVSQVSGVSPDIVRSMLPAVASILIGGLAHAMASLGLSGVLSHLADAMSGPGGLGSTVPQAGASDRGVIGSLFGSMFGGSHSTNPEAAALAAGFATLSAMFVSGVQVAQAHQAATGAIAQSFTQSPPGVGV